MVALALLVSIDETHTHMGYFLYKGVEQKV